MSVKITERQNCRVCSSSDLRHWVRLIDMPLTDDLKRRETVGSEFLHDINVYLCPSCSTAQLMHDTNMEEYYEEYSYTSAASPFTQHFMQKLADTLLDTYHLTNGASVLEVGSGDGMQLTYFQKRGANVLGYEPSEVLCRKSREAGVPVIKGLFTDESIAKIPDQYLDFDVILLTYTFDHIPEPTKFLQSVRKILNKKSGLLVIEVHDIEKIVERNEYCLFEHEHFIYLTTDTMRNLLEQEGFVLVDPELIPEKERRGNSLLVVAACKESVYAKELLMPTSTKKPPIEYDTFALKLENSIHRLDTFVENNRQQGKRVAGFGSGGRGVMTLAAMKNGSQFEYLCDNNTMMHGYYTPKTHVPIVSPTRLLEDPVDLLIVFSYGYIEEIKKQLASVVHRMQVVSLLELLQ